MALLVLAHCTGRTLDRFLETLFVYLILQQEQQQQQQQQQRNVNVYSKWASFLAQLIKKQ